MEKLAFEMGLEELVCCIIIPVSIVFIVMANHP